MHNLISLIVALLLVLGLISMLALFWVMGTVWNHITSLFE